MFGKILIEIAIYFAVATSCSPCYCLFHSLEGGRSYFHTLFDIGAYFKFPVALRIIGKTASSEPGTENVIGIINYQMERSGEFFTCREAARSSRTVGRKKIKESYGFLVIETSVYVLCILVCFYLNLNFYVKHHNFFKFSIEFFNI